MSRSMPVTPQHVALVIGVDVVVPGVPVELAGDGVEDLELVQPALEDRVVEGTAVASPCWRRLSVCAFVVPKVDFAAAGPTAVSRTVPRTDLPPSVLWTANSARAVHLGVEELVEAVERDRPARRSWGPAA